VGGVGDKQDDIEKSVGLPKYSLHGLPHTLQYGTLSKKQIIWVVDV
jgi:hypothetical protein